MKYLNPSTQYGVIEDGIDNEQIEVPTAWPSPSARTLSVFSIDGEITINTEPYPIPNKEATGSYR